MGNIIMIILAALLLTLIIATFGMHLRRPVQTHTVHIPADILDLRYFRGILLQSKQRIGQDELTDVLNHMIDLSTEHHLGMEEWNLMRQIYQKLSKGADARSAERVLDQAIAEVDSLIQKKSQKVQVEPTAFDQSKNVAFVSLVFLMTVFMDFNNLAQSRVAWTFSILSLVGIIIYNVGSSLYNHRSRLARLGLRLATITSVVVLADIIIAIVH